MANQNLTPERLREIQDKIAAWQLKTGKVLTPELLKAATIELSADDPVTWGMAHRELRGMPYRFELPPAMWWVSENTDDPNYKVRNKHRPFLKQMLQDQAQNKCYEKSRQCGASETSVTEVLWFLDMHPHTKALYVFPSNQQMEDFSNSRIKAALLETEYMKKLNSDPDATKNVKLKQIGKSYLFMRSGQTGRLGEGIDCDALFVDEKDRMPDKIESAFEQSLSSSAYRWLREFSTPTLPAVGVDKSFIASCQYYWFVKCDNGHPQTLTYPDNIGQNWEDDPTEEVVVPGTYYYKCSHVYADGTTCPAKINRWKGEWVPKHDNHKRKTHAGYHINQLACVWLSADDVMQQRKKYHFMDLFYNYVLGIPYQSNEGLITMDALMNAIDQNRWFPNVRLAQYRHVVAGIDWGHINWCVVLGLRPDGRWEVCGKKIAVDGSDVLKATKELAEYLEPFRPDLIVADLGWGQDRCMELLRRFPERVFACTYTSGEVTDKTFLPVWSDGAFRVSVNRTAHLKKPLEGIKNRRLLFPGPRDTYDGSTPENKLWKHLLNLAIIHEEEEAEGTRDVLIVEKIGHKGDDHYAHALAYAWLAGEKLTQGGSFTWNFI